MNGEGFTVGNRVVWTGPVGNAQWPAESVGKVVRVRATGLIDILWDHGPTNYGCDPSGFAKVER